MLTRQGIIQGLAKLTGTAVGIAAATGKKVGVVALGGVARVGRAASSRVVGPLLAARSKGGAASEPSTHDVGNGAGAGRGHAGGVPGVLRRTGPASAQRKQGGMHRETGEEQSHLASRLRDLESDKDALISKLEAVRNEAEEATARAALLEERVATLEADLAPARRDPEDSPSGGEDVQPPPAVQPEDTRAESERPASNPNFSPVLGLSWA